MNRETEQKPIWVFAFTEADAMLRTQFLAASARTYALRTGRPPINLAVQKTPTGKPFFSRDEKVHFSISHSGEYWLCAFSEAAVGLDIQVKSPSEYLMMIAQRFFHPDEYQAVQAGGEDIFFRIWTAKESYIKYTGQGLSEDFCRFSCISEGNVTDRIRGTSIRHLTFAPGYSLCVCAQNVNSVQLEFISI